MSLNLGQSRQSQSSQSQADSYGFSNSVSGDSSVSSAIGGGSSSSNQQVFNADIFSQLFGGASDAQKRAMFSAPQITEAAQGLFTGGSQFLQSLGGGAGADYLTSRLSGDNPILQEQIDALSVDTGKFFNEQINPAITSRAVAGGTLGGGRQGVAQGLGAGEAARAFTQGATALRAADVSARDSVAANVANNSVMAASTGLGALPSLLDVIERGNNAELGTYSSLSSILGGPTVLGNSQASNFSSSQSIADAFSRSFGEQRSTSTSSSRGKGSSWNFGASLGGGG